MSGAYHCRLNRICLVALLALSVGCAGKTRYLNAISDNRNNIQRLQLGMHGKEVADIMGEGERGTYRGSRLTNPWRSEAFALQDGRETQVEILYYVTEHQRRLRTATDRELTPVVLENDQVVGWGWSYLRRNLDRYGISTPLEQR